MNKRFLGGILLLGLGGALAWVLVRWYNEREVSLPVATEKEIAKAYEQKFGKLGEPAAPPLPALPLGRSVRLAIGGLGFNGEAVDRDLADLLVARLTGAPGLELVDRLSLDKVLNELQLSLLGLVRAKDAVRAGKLLRADWFLLGTPAVVNGTNVAVLRIVDARTGMMRDATMIARKADAAEVASTVAAFVQQTRQDAGSDC